MISSTRSRSNSCMPCILYKLSSENDLHISQTSPSLRRHNPMQGSVKPQLCSGILLSAAEASSASFQKFRVKWGAPPSWRKRSWHAHDLHDITSKESQHIVSQELHFLHWMVDFPCKVRQVKHYLYKFK
jgi:hypothetical protein